MNATSDSLFKRATDIDIIERFRKFPFEIGANYISRTAVAALELLQEIRKKSGEPIPLALERDGDENIRAIEVYPAVTRLAHGAPDVGGSLEGLGDLVDTISIKSDVLKSKDAVDAMVCVLAAADFARGNSKGPVDKEKAAREGWIWVPNKMSPSD